MSLIVNASRLIDGDTAFIGIRCLPERGAAANRAYHLALLLDTSGSMEEHGRIQTLKRTLHILLDVMKSTDRLTLITYNSNAQILANACALSEDNKADLHAQFDAIQPTGCTNLEKACDALADIVAPIDAVFVLTDGHINRGICDTAALSSHVYTAVVPGTPIYTLGYGADHNADLLRDIAVRSRGSYTFAECDDAIPAIVGTICGGLEHQVGRNARVTGLTSDWTSMDGGDAAIGALIDDKPVWVVLEGPSHADVPPALRLHWTPVETGAETVADICIDASINSIEIAKQRDRARVARALSAITDCLTRNALRDARQQIEACCLLLDSSEARQTEFVRGLYMQLSNIRTELDTQARIALPGSLTALAQSPAPVYRMMSQTTTLMTQQGSAAADDPVFQTFLSPSQRHTSQCMTHRFHSDGDPATPTVD